MTVLNTPIRAGLVAFGAFAGPALAETQASVAGLAVYTAGAPNAPTLVFLHGDSGRASQWFAVMDLLAADYRVVAYDQRGHGTSPEADGAYSYAARASDLAKVIAAEAQGPVVLVAHSGSAGVALDYAQGATNVRGIVFLDPATDPRVMPEEMRAGFMAAHEGPGALPTIQGYYTSIAGSDPGVIATITADAAAVSDAARFGVAQELAYWNPEPAVLGWHGPTLALVTPPNDNPAAIWKIGPGYPHEMLNATGHWPQLEMPATVAEQIAAFEAALSEG